MYSTSLRNRRKGQSAIEYLMTYGWMLLVVAIVGGAIFATVQGQCAQQATGFTGEDATVESFVIGDNLQVEVTNTAGEQIDVLNVTVGEKSNDTETTLGVGNTQIYTIPGIVEADACNDFDVEIRYKRGDFDPATSVGTLTGEMAAQ